MNRDRGKHAERGARWDAHPQAAALATQPVVAIEEVDSGFGGSQVLRHAAQVSATPASDGHPCGQAR
jgi:hypothetical protein